MSKKEYQKTYINFEMSIPIEDYRETLDKLASLMETCRELGFRFKTIIIFKKYKEEIVKNE